MPPPYEQPHYAKFAAIPFVPQGPAGPSPQQWAIELELQGIPDATRLPSCPLDRAGVRAVCQNPERPLLHGYICAMAWGGQEKSLRGPKRVTESWSQRAAITQHLVTLRKGGLTRSDAYNLFEGQGKIKELGPSFFTKLLFFFSPDDDCYIMDQWTAKSVNLLTGEIVVRAYDSSPTAENKGGNYQAYCEEVDALAALLNETGDQIEQRLMSNGGRNPAPWRTHVKSHYPYNKNRLMARYPHIDPEDF